MGNNIQEKIIQILRDSGGSGPIPYGITARRLVCIPNTIQYSVRVLIEKGILVRTGELKNLRLHGGGRPSPVYRLSEQKVDGHLKAKAKKSKLQDVHTLSANDETALQRLIEDYKALRSAQQRREELLTQRPKSNSAEDQLEYARALVDADDHVRDIEIESFGNGMALTDNPANALVFVEALVARLVSLESFAVENQDLQTRLEIAEKNLDVSQAELKKLNARIQQLENELRSLYRQSRNEMESNLANWEESGQAQIKPLRVNNRGDVVVPSDLK